MRKKIASVTQHRVQNDPFGMIKRTEPRTQAERNDAHYAESAIDNSTTHRVWNAGRLRDQA